MEIAMDLTAAEECLMMKHSYSMTAKPEKTCIIAPSPEENCISARILKTVMVSNIVTTMILKAPKVLFALMERNICLNMPAFSSMNCVIIMAACT